MSITSRAPGEADPVEHDLDHPVAGNDAAAVLTRAAAAMARVERDVEKLWRDAMVSDRQVLSQHLAEVCHALRRAVRLLEQDRAFH